MNAYLDASVLVAMFAIDAHRASVLAWLPEAQGRLSLSAWGLTEYTSALRVAERSGRLAPGQRDVSERALQQWLAGRQVEPVRSNDVDEARRLIGATALPLRAGDALHLAIAERLGDAIATFDRRMAAAAADLGLSVEDLSPHA